MTTLTEEDVLEAVHQLARLVRIENAARAFINDLRDRHPEETFRCPFVRALDEALENHDTRELL